MLKRNHSKLGVLGKLVVLCAATGLAGCGKGDAFVDDVPVPTTHYQRYPIEVAKGPVKLDVQAAHGTLSEAQADTVRRFAQTAISNRVSVIHVRRPSGGGRSISVAQDIADLLSDNGIPDSAIVHSTYGAAASAPVLLSYVRAYAVTEECGPWRDNISDNKNNLPHDSFGCSTQHNLAAMVANPMDFEVPRAMTPSDPMRRNQAIGDYRIPKIPATPDNNGADVAISTVAKN
jgi:pilus assembly protein CpaD